MNKRILITGFEPFDTDTLNPSGEWVKYMKGIKTRDGLLIRGLILPVSFKRAFIELKENLDEFAPDIVVLTGFAKNRKTLTMERIGINWIDARIPDNDGVMIKSSKIDQQGPDGIFTTLPIELVSTLFEETLVDIKLSTSAGEYVCNDLLYKTLLNVQKTNNKKADVAFIHIPELQDYTKTFESLNYFIQKI